MQFVLFLAMLALGSTVAAAPARAEAPFTFEATPGDLPKDVRPLAYRIDLVPDLDRLASADGSVDVDFAGTEEVDVELLRATDRFTLNALNLAITRVALD